MPKDNPIKIEEWVNEKGLDRIELQPIYLDLKNEITNPEKVVVVSHYFLDNWAPRLGPTLTLLILRLRKYCYFNKITKEKRDWCYPKHDTLAEDIGVSRYTIIRELQRPIADYFIKREKRYTYDPRTKKKVRTSDMYHITMDDPLLPEDEKILKEKVKERLSKEGKGEGDIKNKPTYLSCKLPLRSQKTVDNSPPKWQFATEDSCGNLQQEEVLLRSTINNVNVDLNKIVKLEELEAQIQVVVGDMLEVLQDPRSKNFYTILVRKILKAHESPQLIYRALSETKIEALSGNIKRSRGAYFTGLIKRYCAEDGIELKK
ncbi:MAG: hypothetical protein V1890_04680 [Candidatus Zixiibacteriota bacterium]